MHNMMNFYNPDLKEVQMYALSHVNNEQKINQNGSVFLVPPPEVPVSTMNTIPIPAPQTNQPYRMPVPCTNYPQVNTWRACEQPVSPVPPNEPHAVPNDLYNCNCLAQLEGSYQTDLPNGDKLQVVLAARGDWQYAIVQRLGSVGEQRLIYDEDSRFTLCSLDDNVVAVMLKGASAMHSLTWYNNDGSLTLWRRIGNKSLAINKQASRPMSTVSSRSSVPNNGAVVPSEVTSVEGLYSRPIMGHLNEDSEKEISESLQVYSSHPSENSPCSSLNSTVNKNYSVGDLFDLLQAHCTKDPVVLQKVLCWGIARTPNRKVANKEIADLGSGRYWINARLCQSVKADCEKWKEILNEIKGAYQEVSTDVYLQPAPKPNEPGIQHRLRRSNFGYWIIEELDVEREVWRPCTQELPNGQWVDCTSGLKLYKI